MMNLITKNRATKITTKPTNNIIIYQNENGETKLDIRFFNENIWISQIQLTELFKTSKPNISMHIRNIFKDNELQASSVVKNFLTTGNDGKNYNVLYYNLDMVIALGYRIKSTTAIHFRQWVANILKDYIQKGFALDDDRMKENNNNYFDELLERIRDIRSSEKVFCRKVLDIYSTSIDYDPKIQITKDFFAEVQNKMHWAVHNKTASELIFDRADSEKDFMGIANINELGRLKKSDVVSAKNYLNESELNILNRLVNAYLEFAELQALDKKAMTMQDWVEKLDIFLKMANKDC